MLMMVFFSICVQMAEGLHYGIVPYISRPALGIVSGMVGAGGNAGALISSKFIVGAKNLDDGFVKLGYVIIFGSLVPHLVKEKEGQKGSDELDFTKAVGSSVTPA